MVLVVPNRKQVHLQLLEELFFVHILINCQQAIQKFASVKSLTRYRGHIGLCFTSDKSQISSDNYGRGATKIDCLPEELIFSTHEMMVCLENSQVQPNAALPSFHTTGIQLS